MPPCHRPEVPPVQPADPKPPALTLERITRQFNGHTVLSDISLQIPAGRITCLLGESGCGKSTLLRIIAGVDRQDGGRILIGGHEVAGPQVFAEPETRSVGFMFQDYALFPHLSVRDNLGFGLRHLPRQTQRERIEEVIDRIGIAHLADRYPNTLSGGEQQRVALARALAPKPQILLMDEPFSNLDQGLRERVRRETVAKLHEIGSTAIIVTHDPQEAMATGDRIVLMREGQIEQVGDPYQIYDHPCSPYAAEFLGPCNTLTGVWENGHIVTPLGRFPASLDLAEGALAIACIRPQAFSIGPDGSGISARIRTKTFLGESEQIDLIVHPLAETLRMHSYERVPMDVGQKVGLRLNGAQVHVFPGAR